MQHTKYGLPDRKQGYSLDDNARALIVAIAWYKLFKNKKGLELARIYLAWLIHAKTDSGYFANFSSFDNVLKKELSEDGFGRAFWALSYAYWAKVRNDLTSPAKTIVDEVAHNLVSIQSPRALAYCLLGLSYLHLADPDKAEWKEKMEILADKLVGLFKKYSTEDWIWFEHIIAYSNHLLPLGLLKAYSIVNKADYKAVGLKTLDFVEGESRLNAVPAPVGSNGWFVKDGERATYDQQPIEASEAVLAHLAAFEITNNPSYKQKAQDWADWYMGNNIQKVSLIDTETGGCYDALMSHGVNKNEGAESIIAFLMTQLAVSDRDVF